MKARNQAAVPPPLPEVREARRERRLAAGLAALGVLVFATAAVLDPYDAGGSPRSLGTHRQLGLPACAFQALTGTGCPSCGMTTTFSLLMHGDPISAWHTNWAGCIAAVLGILGTIWFVLVAIGLPYGRLTGDEAIKVMVAVGTGTALIRWLSLVGSSLLAATA